MTQQPAVEPTRLVPTSTLRFGAGFDSLFPILYALAFAGLGIALQLRCFPIGDIDLETDFYGDLVIAARHLAEGHFAVHDFAYKGPLYSFVLVLLRGITGDWYRGGIVLSALAGGAYLALTYRLVRRLFDRRVAISTMVAASLVVEFFVQFHRATTDVLFLVLSLGSMTCTLLAGRSWRRHAVAGGLAALAFLTRYNGIFLVGGTALVLAVVNPDGLERRRRLKLFGLYAVTFLLVCAPWFIANEMETGRVLATRNVENIVAAFYGTPRWQDDPVANIRSFPTLFAMHPGHFITQFARNLMEHLGKDLSLLLGWPLALLPLAGLLGFTVRRPTRRQISLYAFAGAYWLFMGIVFYAPRFSLPIVLPYMAAGFSFLQGGSLATTRMGDELRRWLQGRGRAMLAWSALAVFLLALGGVQVGRIVRVERTLHARRPLYILQAARALAQLEPGSQSSSRPRIVARKGHLAYYAGFDFAPCSPNAGPLDELVGFAQAQGARYIAYSTVEYSLLPHLLYMAVTDTVPLLQEVYRGPSTRIFRVASGERTALSDTERHKLLLASVRAARMQGRPATICVTCEDLGLYELRTGQFAAAAVSFQDAIDAVEPADNDPELERAAADARCNLAIAQLNLGRPATAIALLQKNLEYFTAQGSQQNIARAHATLGHAYDIMGREADARREYHMAGNRHHTGGDIARSDGAGNDFFTD